MTKGKRYSRWHSSVSAAAIGVLAFSFSVQAGPTRPGRGGNGPAATSADGRIQRLIDQGKLTITPAGAIEEISADAEYLGVIHNDAFNASGGVASHILEVPSYSNTSFAGTAFFFNFQPTTTTGATNLQGAFHSNNMKFANGFVPGDVVTSYSALLFRSSLDPATSLLADITIELWDGDPLAVWDTGVNGFTNMPIAGTATTFTGIPVNTFAVFSAELPAPAVIPGQIAWMTITTNSCRLGWILSNTFAEVGGLVDDVFEVATDDDGVGFCCADGSPCDQPNGIFCAGDGTGSRRFCSDGDAERPRATFFGGPCTGDPILDNCATVWSTVNSPAKNTMSVIPTASLNAAAEGVISGNALTLVRGGTEVVLDIQVADWDSEGLGVEVGSYQATLEVGSYTSGLFGTLVGSEGVNACTTSADCLPIYGGICSALGNPCSGPSDCMGFEFCNSNTSCVEFCGFGVSGCGNMFCAPGFVSTSRPDYIFNVTPPRTFLPATDISTPRVRLGAAITAGGPVAPPSPFPAGGVNLGSFALQVPGDATGTFTIDLEVPPDSQVLDDATAQGIPLMAIIPATITIPTGQCCDIGAATPVCLDDTVTADQCAALAAVTNFDPSKTCADQCIQCLNFGGTDPNCDDGDACTDDACDALGFCTNVLNFTDDLVSCYDGAGATCDAALLSDGDDCTDDVCDGGGNRGIPSSTQSADGSGCDDANPCTYDDTCTAGACAGLDANVVTCGTSADCLTTTGVAFDCVTGLCFCTIAPTFSPVVTASGNGNPSCFDAGQKVTVDMTVGAAASVINGAQFTLNYDPSCLQFVSIGPAGGLYVTELLEIVDEVAGQILYAVGVDANGGAGANGNVAVATASFTKIGSCNSCDICVTDGLFADENGDAVFADNQCSGALSDNSSASVSVPASVKVNADCNANTATVLWAAPTVSTSCAGGASLSCTGMDANANDLSAIAMTGGTLPLGISTFSCTAVDATCGGGASASWTVEVNDMVALDVSVQLSPTMASGALNLTRCIDFEVYSDCLQPPLSFQRDLVFGGPGDLAGRFTQPLKIPASGAYACITAQDILHTLRSCDFLTCSGGRYSATFSGDPFLGGNWLVNGNLDAWSLVPGAGPNVINILDFGQYIAEFGNTTVANTLCGTAGPHADINGDGTVDTLDFTFIAMNFGANSIDCCCGAAASDTSSLLTEVSVLELRQMGLGHMAVADLNGDGLVNLSDMNAFTSGQRPATKVRKVREGSGIRSR